MGHGYPVQRVSLPHLVGAAAGAAGGGDGGGTGFRASPGRAHRGLARGVTRVRPPRVRGRRHAVPLVALDLRLRSLSTHARTRGRRKRRSARALGVGRGARGGDVSRRRAGSGRSRGPLGRRGASGLARPGSFRDARRSRSLRRRDARTSVESRSDTHQHRDGDDGATRHERPQDAPEQRRPVVVLAVVVRGAIGGRTLLGRAAVRGVLAGGAVGARHGGGSANARARWSAEPDRPATKMIVLINSCGFPPTRHTEQVRHNFRL